MESRTIGLVADPEVPTEIAQELAEELAEVLTESVSDQINWQVQVKTYQLPLNDDGQIEAWRRGDSLLSSQGWDYVVCLTELSRLLNGRFVVSDVNRARYTAVISLPALGPVRLVRQTRQAVIRVVRELLDEKLQPERSTGGGGKAMRRLSRDVRSPRREESADEQGDTISHLPMRGPRGRIRLLGGMVRINRPWRLIPSLSSAFAAAAAVAAFGIFYSSIWSMSDSLTPLRLFSISIIAVAAMIAWLVFYNGLWEKPANPALRQSTAMNNSATVLTLAIGVVCFYLLLFILTTLAALVVIPSSYMDSTLAHSVTWLDYAALAWLSTSMGTIAGALGSSFESDSAIRQATYGRRELERYDKTHDDE